MLLLSCLYYSFDPNSVTPHVGGAAAAEGETISAGNVTELTFIWNDVVKSKTKPNQSFSHLNKLE